jgi:hypothetical protein
VLDLGGTQSYWESNDAVDADVFRVTLVNLPMNTAPTTRENFESRVGDATDLSAIDRTEFDLVYSNSVIEHLATLENQERMAEQIQSLDLPFWIQTPNYHFPMEPHFHVMGFQWMSRERRIRMLQKKRCGMRGPVPEREGAAALVDEIRLLKCREVRQMFPNATIYRERIGPFTKSIVAHQGLG